MQASNEHSALPIAPLRVIGIVQVALCLLYGGFAMLTLFGLAMCNDSGRNGTICAHAWWAWLAAATAAAVNFALGIAMIAYVRPASASGMTIRMRAYVAVSVIAWVIVANFVRLTFSGQ